MADDLVSSAVTFLQDPKVADAPLAKRIAFLESKGLSTDQVQQALQRAQEDRSTASPTTSHYDSTRAPVLPPSTYSSYAMQQQLPPPVPKRDWRDWFIMAVVSGGFSWAIYFLAKHYVAPLISPPTQSQLETDKEAISAQFDQVQEMLSILQKDTEQVRLKGTERNEKLETALSQVDAAVQDMQQKTARRENDIRRLGLEMDQLKEMIPKAIEAVKTAQNDSLSDLGGELRSLKTLLQNRMKATGGQSASASAPSAGPSPSSDAAQATSSSSTTQNDSLGATASQKTSSSSSTSAAVLPSSSHGTSTTTRSSGGGTNNDALSRFTSRGIGNGIPEWQKSASPLVNGAGVGVGVETSDVDAGSAAATAKNVHASDHVTA